jgi:hypothetical protein
VDRSLWLSKRRGYRSVERTRMGSVFADTWAGERDSVQFQQRRQCSRFRQAFLAGLLARFFMRGKYLLEREHGLRGVLFHGCVHLVRLGVAFRNNFEQSTTKFSSRGWRRISAPALLLLWSDLCRDLSSAFVPKQIAYSSLLMDV